MTRAELQIYTIRFSNKASSVVSIPFPHISLEPRLLSTLSFVGGMAAVSPHLASTFPLLQSLRTPPRRLPPAVSAVPLLAARVVLRGFRLPDPAARKFLCFENSISLQMEHQKQLQFASERDSTSTNAKQNSSSDDNSSSSDGPPVLTILAGIIVFLLVLWVMGSLVTWIAGLVFGAAKS